MSEEEYPEPTFVEIVCEARLNPTELRETIEDILTEFLPGDVRLDERFDGDYLLIRQSGVENLRIFSDWVRQQHILDTVRDRFIRSISGNITALYFNRQAAAMGRLSLLDVNDDPPNGPIVLQVVSDGLMKLSNKILPRTWKGRELTEEEWEQVRARQERQKARRERQKEREEEYRQKYNR